MQLEQLQIKGPNCNFSKTKFACSCTVPTPRNTTLQWLSAEHDVAVLSLLQIQRQQLHTTYMCSVYKFTACRETGGKPDGGKGGEKESFTWQKKQHKRKKREGKRITWKKREEKRKKKSRWKRGEEQRVLNIQQKRRKIKTCRTKSYTRNSRHPSPSPAPASLSLSLFSLRLSWPVTLSLSKKTSSHPFSLSLSVHQLRPPMQTP